MDVTESPKLQDSLFFLMLNFFLVACLSVFLVLDSADASSMVKHDAQESELQLLFLIIY